VLEPDDEFDGVVVLVALALYLATAALAALGVAALVKDMPGVLVPWIGLAFGVAMYSAIFFGVARLCPWLASLRGFDTLGSHMLFGTAAAVLYRYLATIRPVWARGALWRHHGALR
jgi:hypothetical protein